VGEGAFTATHQAPVGGIDTWAVPDPSKPPDHHIDADQPVQLLEETTGWAHVRCTNDWEAWVDASKLVALATPGFVPTHRVIASGADARKRPDMGEPVGARVDGGLPVSIVNTWGGWSKVHFENGWEAWLDTRGLVAGTAPASGAGAVAGPVSPLAMWLPVVGAALAIGGGFLHWIGDVSAWKLGIVGMFTHKAEDLFTINSSGGVSAKTFGAGILLLLTLGAAIPLFTRRLLPRPLAFVLAGVATSVSLLGLLLYLDKFKDSPNAGIGIGLFVTLIGGVAMAIGALMTPHKASRAAVATT
jgi:hypothetical protein